MNFGLQLYTTRQLGALQTQLALASATGFNRVETVGFQGHTPEAAAALLRHHGMSVASCHFDWQEFEQQFEPIQRFLTLTGSRVAVMPWLAPHERPTDSAGWCALRDVLGAWAEQLAAQQVTLAYHNHDFDLQGGLGHSGLDVLLSHPLIHWQVDVGWVVAAGESLSAWIGAYRQKIVSIHAKDVLPEAGRGDARWRDLGEGCVNWSALWAQLKGTSCTDAFVEHDNTPDHLRTLRMGHRMLSALTKPQVEVSA